MHYERWTRRGSFDLPSRPSAEERFRAKFVPGAPDDCWEWQGIKNRSGYGVFPERHGHNVFAHRRAYESMVAPIPAGLTIDHLCKNRACVNPKHMETVTRSENVRRGEKVLAGRYAARTHCQKGHPFDEANTYLRPDGGRKCRACEAERSAQRTRARRGN